MPTLWLCSSGFALPSLALGSGPVSWAACPRDGARAAGAEARIRIVANADLTATDRSVPRKGKHGCPPGEAEEENQAELASWPVCRQSHPFHRQSNVVWYGWVEFKPKLDPAAEAPLYRQLSDQIAQQIRSGLLTRGERLPATRELAGSLGLNRTTVSAAYEILESEGLISGQVGRGSFVTGGAVPADGVDWNALLERSDTAMDGPHSGWRKHLISLPVSRPSRDLFPLDEFRATCATVLARRDLADILQLGSPAGYEPLRRHLMAEARRPQGAGPGDDLLITNGCQQALDFIGRSEEHTS